jgi:PTS system mannose-specific IID component
MALQGNVVGTLIWLAWNLAVLFLIRPKLFDLGYTQGIKLVTSMSATMQALTDAAGVLGLTVTGSMIASMVKFPLATITKTIGTDATTGDPITVTYNLQSYADQIMPKLFPALLAWLCYWMLGKKWMNSNKLIWIIIALAILLRLVGILA